MKAADLITTLTYKPGWAARNEPFFRALLIAQEGECALCDAIFDESHKHRRVRAYVDHDHETGLVRGLLCHSCNVAVGYLEHRLAKVGVVANPDFAKRAEAYIDDPPVWTVTLGQVVHDCPEAFRCAP